VDPDAPVAFTEALAELLGSPTRRQALSDAGRAHASTFTWRRTAESTRAAWQLALEHRAERHG
jgi:glycosyltransferase involved in cell wall biosynthesis